MRTVYFIDRDLGYRIFPDALEEAGLTVVRHDDHFRDHATPDTVWLREAIAKIYRPTPKELVFDGKPGSVKQVRLPHG